MATKRESSEELEEEDIRKRARPNGESHDAAAADDNNNNNGLQLHPGAPEHHPHHHHPHHHHSQHNIHHHHHNPHHHHHHHEQDMNVFPRFETDDTPLDPSTPVGEEQQQQPSTDHNANQPQQQQQSQQQQAPPPSYETVRFKDPALSENFNDFLFALISHKAEFGTYQVDKERCPTLHSWLQSIKRDYARHVHNNNNTQLMTLERRKVLESLHVPLTHRGDDHWNRFFQMLIAYKARHGHVLVPRICETPGLGDWVTDQRRQHKAWKAGKASQLTTERRTKLEELGFAWQVRNRPEWDQRYQELLDYKDKHGDCKVPQHYRENKALGKWVAKQREQYKLKQKGQHSFLTPDREEKLDRAGFLWSVRAANTNLSTPTATAANDTPPMENHAELHNPEGPSPMIVPTSIKVERGLDVMQMMPQQPQDVTTHPESMKPNDDTDQGMMLQHQSPHPQDYFPTDNPNLTV